MLTYVLSYISLQAKNALGFDTLVRRQVELNICQSIENDNEDLEYLINTYSNCFYIPLLIVYSVLEKVFFNKFLNSPMYKKYIDEILSNTIIKSNPETIQEKKMEAKPKTDFIDETLWSNELGSNMQIGSIDSTGRFIRYLKIEPEIENQNNSLSNEDAWNLNDSTSLDTLDTKSSPGSSNIFKIKTKLDKFINMIPINGRTKYTQDDYQLAEKIASNLVNEVIQLNQLN